MLPGLENYNQYQLFFINNAQVWCSKYRDQYLRHQVISATHSPGQFRYKTTLFLDSNYQFCLFDFVYIFLIKFLIFFKFERINGPTSNSEDFAKAFNCKLGQKNNPIKKCSVW